MPSLLKSLSGLFSVTLPLLLASMLLLSSCSGLSPVSLLTGGGPNVAANVQVGKENSQAVVSQTTRIEAGGDVQQSRVISNGPGEVTVQEVPPWVVLLLILGWLLPSPGEIARWTINLFKRKKDNA